MASPVATRSDVRSIVGRQQSVQKQAQNCNKCTLFSIDSYSLRKN